MQHLAVKERHVYAKLEIDQRLPVRAFFEKSKADLVARFDEYTAHMEAWPTSRAVSDWRDYSPKAIAVVRKFTERFEREEQELFDVLARNNIDISTPAAVTSNWTRRAFDVKARVDDHK